MSFATNMRTVANTLLTNYGRSVSLHRVVEGDYNPMTSDVGPGTTTTYSGYGHPSPYSVSEISLGFVTDKDVRLLLYTTTEPLVGDTATIDGSVYRVLAVEKLNAQGLNIVYRLQLRI